MSKVFGCKHHTLYSNQTNLWVVADLLGLGGVFYSKLMWLEIIATSDINLLVLLSFD